jgi:hypothetical protein
MQKVQETDEGIEKSIPQAEEMGLSEVRSCEIPEGAKEVRNGCR